MRHSHSAEKRGVQLAPGRSVTWFAAMAASSLLYSLAVAQAPPERPPRSLSKAERAAARELWKANGVSFIRSWAVQPRHHAPLSEGPTDIAGWQTLKSWGNLADFGAI